MTHTATQPLSTSTLQNINLFHASPSTLTISELYLKREEEKEEKSIFNKR